MTWKARLISHRNEPRIAIEFPKNEELNLRIRKIKDSRWSKSLRCWHIPDTVQNRIQFKVDKPIQNKYSANQFIKIEKINQFKLWLQSKRYSDNTIKTYSDALKTFLFYFQVFAIL